MKTNWAGRYSGLERMRAKGRNKKPGDMNKLEASYNQHLQMQLAQGLIAWFAFEGLKLRLADNTFLTVDFFVMLNSGELHAIDTKGGFIEEDSKVKMKVAAEMYPFAFFIAQKRKVADGGGWKLTEI